MQVIGGSASVDPALFIKPQAQYFVTSAVKVQRKKIFDMKHVFLSQRQNCVFYPDTIKRKNYN